MDKTHPIDDQSTVRSFVADEACSSSQSAEAAPIQSLVLEAPQTGRAPKYFSLFRGRQVTVGRSQTADFDFGTDDEMSRTHFSVALHGDRGVLRDLGSKNGTWLNGHEITVAELRHGDKILAGATAFFVYLIAVPDVTDSSSQSICNERTIVRE